MSKKKIQKPITRQEDIFDLVLDGLVQVVEAALVFLCSQGWKFLSEKLDGPIFKRQPKTLSVDTLKTASKFSNWEMPLFSHRQGKETDFSKIDFNKNSLVMGTTGQGKNVLMDSIINERLSENLPVVFIAPKGDVQDVIKFKLLNQLHNRKCVAISDTLVEDHFNPIAEGGVAAITERIHSSFEWSEQYYSDVAYNALKESIDLIKNPEKRTKKYSFKKKLSKSERSEGEDDKNYKVVEVEKNIKVSGNTTPTFAKIEEVLDQLFPEGTNERKETIGLINKISKINSSSFSELFNNENGWTFSRIREERRSVIFSISNLRFPELCKMLGKVIVLDLQNHASDVLELDDKTKDETSSMSVVIDELGAVATTSFINLFNQCRAAKLSVMAAFQCLADLNTVGPDFQSRVLSNTNNFFIGSMKHPEEAELLAKMVGTNATKKVTKRTEFDEELEDGSVRDAHEFIIPPDLFKNANTAIFIVKTFLGKHSVNDIVTVKMKFSPENLRRMVETKRKESRRKPKVVNHQRRHGEAITNRKMPHTQAKRENRLGF